MTVKSGKIYFACSHVPFSLALISCPLVQSLVMYLLHSYAATRLLLLFNDPSGRSATDCPILLHPTITQHPTLIQAHILPLQMAFHPAVPSPSSIIPTLQKAHQLGENACNICLYGLESCVWIQFSLLVQIEPVKMVQSMWMHGPQSGCALNKTDLVFFRLLTTKCQYVSCTTSGPPAIPAHSPSPQH